MSLKNLTVEEREKLRQENPEEYEKLAAEELSRPKTVSYINGRAVESQNTGVHYQNGKLVQK